MCVCVELLREMKEKPFQIVYFFSENPFVPYQIFFKKNVLLYSLNTIK